MYTDHAFNYAKIMHRLLFIYIKFYIQLKKKNKNRNVDWCFLEIYIT